MQAFFLQFAWRNIPHRLCQAKKIAVSERTQTTKLSPMDFEIPDFQAFEEGGGYCFGSARLLSANRRF